MKFFGYMLGNGKKGIDRQGTEASGMTVRSETYGSGVVVETRAREHRHPNNRTAKQPDVQYVVSLTNGVVNNTSLASIVYYHDRTNDTRHISMSISVFHLIDDLTFIGAMQQDKAFAQRIRALAFTYMDAAQ